MSWSKLSRHLGRETRIVVVSTVERYRRLASTETQAEDIVLEVGCSTGSATRALAKRAAQIVAVDLSAEVTARLSADLRDLRHVTVARVDGRNAGELKVLCPDPDLIFIDIGGDALLPNVVSVLRICLLAFAPRLLVVRSFELAILQSLLSAAELPPDAASSDGANWFDMLLDLSRSVVDSDRVFAARQLRMLCTKAAKTRLLEMADDPHSQVRRIVGREKEDKTQE